MERIIAHVTDLHLDEIFPIELGVKAKENWEIILKDISKRQITEVVFTGDIGTYESNQWFFDSLKDYHFDFKIVLGNHDLFSEVLNYYVINLPNNQKELYYFHEDEFNKYLYLDSSLAVLSNAQFNWFLQQLITDKKIVLFIHHPILETGTTPQREYPLKECEKIRDILLRHKNEVYVFCGHLHFNDVQKEKNITQILTPAACYQVKRHSQTTEADNINFGYRIIKINKNNISTEVVMFQPSENKTITKSQVK